MKALRDEIAVNFAKFSVAWPKELTEAHGRLAIHTDRYRGSYERLVSLQAWRTTLLQDRITADSLSFFLEAQNDALVSHILASLGSWRAALQALRSTVENALACLYYMDHPVELELWKVGRHKLTFGAVQEYLDHHPRYMALKRSESGMELLGREYATLSKAVHGSAIAFRMTGEAGTTQLWLNDLPRLGAWATRESSTLLGLNLVLLAMFRDSLTGTKLPNLRKAISLAIPTSMHPRLRVTMGVTLFKP